MGDGLQEIVDALSVRLGRPVLVDDVDLRPLAYSSQFGELDSVRTASILGRTAPDAARDALFARNPDTVDYVVGRSPVGNLYVNRAITGAMVARQPFGGNRLSGTGTKAGGPGYLLQFVEPRVVTENTMRHGIPVE